MLTARNTGRFRFLASGEAVGAGGAAGAKAIAFPATVVTSLGGALFA